MKPKLTWIYPAEAQRWLGDKLVEEDDDLVQHFCWRFKQHKYLPDPPIKIHRNADGTVIIKDGIHRLSALVYNGVPEDLFVEEI